MTKTYRSQRIYHSIGSKRYVVADVKFSSFRNENGVAIVGNEAVPVSVCSQGYIVRKQKGH